MKTISPTVMRIHGKTLQRAGFAAIVIAELLRENVVERADIDDGQPLLSERVEDGLIAALDILGSVIAGIGDHLAEGVEELKP